MILSNGGVASIADTLADRAPAGLATRNYYPAGSSLELSGLWSSYAQLYRRQIWVSTVIRKLAFSNARLPFVVSRLTATGRVPADTTPFAALMARPSPRIDPFSLWLWTSSTYDIYGEAYWFKLRDGSGRVRELHPMHPNNLTIKRNENGAIVYIHHSGSRVADLPEIPETDVVPFRNFNPENLLRGLSNLEPLRQTLLNEDAARRATASWWAKGARPSVMLNHPKRLSDDALTRLRTQVETTHGGADNTGSAMVLEEGMTATVVQLTAEEMQYIESRKLNREEVCGAYDVPPPVVHILDKATFSNITEQMRSMYRDTMTPRLGLFESVIDHHLRPDLDPKGELSGSFDLESVLRGDFEARAAAVAPLIAHGVYKPSEARPLFGLPDAGPSADKLYATSTLQELGAPAARVTYTDPKPIDLTVPTLAAAAITGRDPAVHRLRVRALMGTLGTKAPDRARAALVAAHRSALRSLFDQQHQAVSSAQSFDPGEWDAPLADVLGPLTEVTAKSAGARVARLLGASFAYAQTEAYLSKGVELTARNINGATARAIDAVLHGELPNGITIPAALVHLFGDVADARAEAIAEERVNSVANFAEVEAGKQSGGGTKTWVVNSDNPRPDHAAMDGESVALDDDFSNGLHFPGDPTGSADDNAGCTCTLQISSGGTQ